MKLHHLWMLCLLVLTLVLPLVLYAQGIQNGDFEGAQVNPGSRYEQIDSGSNRLNYWQVEVGNIDYIGGYWRASSGTKSVDLNGSIPSAISQSFETVIGRTYYVEFDFSGNPVCDSPTSKVLEVSAANTSSVYPFSITGITTNAMGWETRVFEFVATEAVTTLKFTSRSVGRCGPAIDNVRLTNCAGMAITDQCGKCLKPSDPGFNDCLDCAGTPNGLAMVDQCGRCLEPADSGFNSCLDCAGVPNGTATIDECNNCLTPTASNFNSCLDCAGIPNGPATTDKCGNCLDPTDSSFNGCLDCAGEPFGTAELNKCGECLDPFSQIQHSGCDEQQLLFIPNVFSPNNDQYNERFYAVQQQGIVREVLVLRIFNRWGSEVFHSSNFNIHTRSGWWDGRLKNRQIAKGVYFYFLKVEFVNGDQRIYKGDVTVTE